MASRKKPRVVEMLDTQSAVSHLAPGIIMVFGLGWLVGADASWHWGLLVMVGAGFWQYMRNRRQDSGKE